MSIDFFPDLKVMGKCQIFREKNLTDGKFHGTITLYTTFSIQEKLIGGFYEENDYGSVLHPACCHSCSPATRLNPRGGGMTEI